MDFEVKSEREEPVLRERTKSGLPNKGEDE